MSTYAATAEPVGYDESSQVMSTFTLFSIGAILNVSVTSTGVAPSSAFAVFQCFCVHSFLELAVV